MRDGSNALPGYARPKRDRQGRDQVQLSPEYSIRTKALRHLWDRRKRKREGTPE